MSRWLKSVNHLLESLDGTAGNVASETTLLPSSRGAIGQILSARGMTYEEGDSEEESEDDEDYDDYESHGDEENQNIREEVVDFTNNPDDVSQQDQAGMVSIPFPPSAPKAQHLTDSVSHQESKEETKLHESISSRHPVVTETHVDVGGYTSDITSDEAVIINKPCGDVESVNTEEPSSPKLPDKIGSPPSSVYNLPPKKKVAPSSGLSMVSVQTDVIQMQLKKLKQELKKSQNETRQLRKHVVQLNEELESSEAEVKAQQAELARAAERMERDRKRAETEREELLDDQEEELENQRAQFNKELAVVKERYEEQIEELEHRLSELEEKRIQEGGDWTKELEDTIQRERDLIKKANILKEENSNLKSSVTKLDGQQQTLQAKLDSALQASQLASRREREAEDKLDAALSLHSRQMNQRQAREADLERTIAELGAALTRSRHKEKMAPTQGSTPVTPLKEQYELAVEELESVRGMLSLERERCDALRNELNEIAREKASEAVEAQERQRNFLSEISDMKSTISRLQAAVRDRKSSNVIISDDCNSPDVIQKLEDAKTQIAMLSEQVFRHHNADQVAKQEILALKNRLQAAVTRAEAAEAANQTSNRYRSDVMEGNLVYGVTSMPKRVKTGRTRTNVRSIRSSIGMNQGLISDGMEQLALTIDALDSFMIETGSYMKQEPLARLGFFLYFSLLHLWCFCLVVFHASAYDNVHGDFGSMRDPTFHSGQGIKTP
jgi:myosin heavy subunit